MHRPARMTLSSTLTPFPSSKNRREREDATAKGPGKRRCSVKLPESPRVLVGGRNTATDREQAVGPSVETAPEEATQLHVAKGFPIPELALSKLQAHVRQRTSRRPESNEMPVDLSLQARGRSDDTSGRFCLRKISRVAMSDGLRPLMRPAWPSEIGRTRSSFSRASARSCGIAR